MGEGLDWREIQYRYQLIKDSWRYGYVDVQ